MPPDPFARWLEPLHQEMCSALLGNKYTGIYVYVFGFPWLLGIDMLCDFGFRLLSSAVEFHVGPLLCRSGYKKQQQSSYKK